MKYVCYPLLRGLLFFPTYSYRILSGLYSILLFQKESLNLYSPGIFNIKYHFICYNLWLHSIYYYAHSFFWREWPNGRTLFITCLAENLLFGINFGFGGFLTSTHSVIILLLFSKIIQLLHCCDQTGFSWMFFS